METPPPRTITRENATVFLIEDGGLTLPIDDGLDVPGWEYVVLRTVDGMTVRMPTKREGY
jgi:hypothetical protein